MKRKIKKKRNMIYPYALVFLVGFLLALLIFNPNEVRERVKIVEIKEVVKEVEETDQISEASDARISKASSNVVAVDQNRIGLVGRVEVEVTPGNGRVLINTNPFLEPDTQFSANIAAFVASNITKISLENKNIIYDFDINGTVVGGASAGASMTLATIAALQNKELKNFGITGIIFPNGDIGKVGAILEKGEAIALNNLDLYLIPNEQSEFVYYERETTRTKVGGVTVLRTRYIPKEINIINYFRDEHNLTVIEVSNIQEAMKYAFQ